VCCLSFLIPIYISRFTLNDLFQWVLILITILRVFFPRLKRRIGKDVLSYHLWIGWRLIACKLLLIQKTRTLNRWITRTVLHNTPRLAAYVRRWSQQVSLVFTLKNHLSSSCPFFAVNHSWFLNVIICVRVSNLLLIVFLLDSHVSLVVCHLFMFNPSFPSLAFALRRRTHFLKAILSEFILVQIHLHRLDHLFLRVYNHTFHISVIDLMLVANLHSDLFTMSHQVLMHVPVFFLHLQVL